MTQIRHTFVQKAQLFMKDLTRDLDAVRDHYADVARKAQSKPHNIKEDTEDKASKYEVIHAGKEVATAVHGAERMATLPKAAVFSCRGCADSVGRANLQTGEIVLDLGSGGGSDVIVAARQVGDQGFVYGLDMTDEMLMLARNNACEAGVKNIEFLKGHIENIPLASGCMDVVLSNCVLNFSADKHAALQESFRVLKPGGRIIISDIVSFAPVPPEVYNDLCATVGCTNGISTDDEYKALFKDVGFINVTLTQTALFSSARLEEKALLQKHEGQLASLKAFSEEIDKISGSVIFEARKPGNLC